ncbi:protein of unknown function [Acetoanaerobium sticklandii]|uniref:Uncharacterized protein n=1 Tax=Acetoanaerobium sticklandii (strain ATCC 12662 / DSM 519 / JCM 1433 / CCUG 9281 / NCIMB 10654 / HF) TaxID=499177 RepID=E3PTT1_ACESD|nr:protein of unknown function [Acetoanaerobium sticklandii]
MYFNGIFDTFIITSKKANIRA